MHFEPTPKWSVRMFADSMHRFHTPQAPCLPYRVMQRVVLGIVWERLEPREPWYCRALGVLNDLFGDSDGWSSTRHWRGRDEK